MAELRRRTDMIDPWPSTGSDRGGGHLGTMLLATVLGVGVGLLAAPQPGARTRSALRKRLAAVGEDIGEELEPPRGAEPAAAARGPRSRRGAAPPGTQEVRGDVGESCEDFEDDEPTRRTRAPVCWPPC